MKAIDQLFLASYLQHHVKQAGLWDATKTVADVGSYFIPGVGTARLGYDAYKDFRHGNYWGGAGKVLLSGASLVPGAGVGAGVVRGATRLLGTGALRGLTRVGMPALGKATQTVISKGVPGALEGTHKVMRAIPKGLGKGTTAAVGALPKIGPSMANPMRAAGQLMRQHPNWTAGAVATGGVGLGVTQGIVNNRQDMKHKANQAQGNLMRQVRQHNMYSPLWGPGGPRR